MADLTSIYPDLEQNFTPTDTGSNLASYSKKVPGGGPIVILIHGYPQSAYIWRYVVPKLSPHVSVFVPELPGYGISTPAKEPLTKRIMGHAILDALSTVFSLPKDKKTPIVFVAHDRGARVSHRLAVDYAHPSSATSPLLKQLELKGIVLMDILPTIVQWSSSANNPSAAAGYFHWPLLARPDMAIPMIQAYGGDRFCRELLEKGTGKSEKGRASFFANDSAEVYARNFKTDDAIKGACDDYADGATGEVQLQREDQEAGRKITVPTLVLWSLSGIGRWGDVGEIWKSDWAEERVTVEGHGIGNGIGHFLAEEAPDVVSKHVTGFLGSVGIRIE